MDVHGCDAKFAQADGAAMSWSVTLTDDALVAAGALAIRELLARFWKRKEGADGKPLADGSYVLRRGLFERPPYWQMCPKCAHRDLPKLRHCTCEECAVDHFHVTCEKCAFKHVLRALS